MNDRKEQSSRLSAAVEAMGILWGQRFGEFTQESEGEAHITNAEIERLPISQRNGRFYGRFFPLLEKLAVLFVETYRRYFKLALANPDECGSDSHEWAWNHLRARNGLAIEWIEDWFVLACDGENRYVRRIASIPFVPGKAGTVSIPMEMPTSLQLRSWYAPCWTFLVSPLMGIVHLRTENMPETDSDERLSAAHNRLLFKGIRNLFLHKLRAEIETARNEEIAAAGAIANPSAASESSAGKRRSTKPRPKGFEGLRKQRDLSQYDQYMDGLTEKQRMALSLRLEYGCRPGEIAVRMGISRKTAWGHIQAAQTKIDQLRSNDKHKAQRSKHGSE